jgi:hypothetical protein
LSASPELLAKGKGLIGREETHTWGSNVMAGDGEHIDVPFTLHLQVRAKATALTTVASGTNTHTTRDRRAIRLRKRMSRIRGAKGQCRKKVTCRLANLHCACWLDSARPDSLAWIRGVLVPGETNHHARSITKGAARSPTNEPDRCDAAAAAAARRPSASRGSSAFRLFPVSKEPGLGYISLRRLEVIGGASFLSHSVDMPHLHRLQGSARLI